MLDITQLLMQLAGRLGGAPAQSPNQTQMPSAEQLLAGIDAMPDAPTVTAVPVSPSQPATAPLVRPVVRAVPVAPSAPPLGVPPLSPLTTENIPPSNQIGANYADVGAAAEPPDLTRAAPNSSEVAPPLAPPQPRRIPHGPATTPTNTYQPGIMDNLHRMGRALAGHQTMSPSAENSTFDALIARGVDSNMAHAILGNPAMLAAALPMIFSPRTQVINNRIVDSATGRVIADLSDSARQGPQIVTLKLRNGDEVSAVWNARQNRYEFPDGTPIAPSQVAPEQPAPTLGTAQPPPANAPAAPPAASPAPGTPPPASGTPLVAPVPPVPSSNVTPPAAPGAPPPDVNNQVYRKTLATGMAEKRAAAVSAFPELERAFSALTESIDSVVNDPNLRNVTGWQATPGIATVASLSSANQDTLSRISQVQGQTFLQAYNQLRGGGAITEREGQAAVAAYNRLQNLRQTDTGYRQALLDFRREAERMMDIARVNVGQPAQGQTDDPSAQFRQPPAARAPAAAPAAAAPQNIPEGATATNPDTGAKLIRRNGQWQPM